MVKKIVVVHSKKSALEDTVKLCHYPVVIMTLQSKPLEVFENRLDVYSSLLVSFLLCSTQVEDGAVTNLAAPTNSCCGNTALRRSVQQRLKCLFS